MNGFSKRLLGWAGGAAALALVAGITPAWSNSFTLDPAAAGFGDGTITPFATGGGAAIGYMGLTVPSTATGSYTFQAAVQINDFVDPTLTTFLSSGLPGGTGLNFDGAKGWEFFITVQVSGTGTWGTDSPLQEGSKFHPNATPTITLDLWGTKSNLTTNFTVPGVSDTIPDGTVAQLCAFGLSNCAGSDFVLLGTAIQSLTDASSFEFIDPQDVDTISFTLATTLTLNNPAFFGVADGSTTPLFIRSGCTEGVPSPIGLTDGAQATQPFVSQNPGGGCNPPSNTDQEHDKITWDFGAPTTVPEPASLAILGSALLGFGLIRRRRNG